MTSLKFDISLLLRLVPKRLFFAILICAPIWFFEAIHGIDGPKFQFLSIMFFFVFIFIWLSSFFSYARMANYIEHSIGDEFSQRASEEGLAFDAKVLIENGFLHRLYKLLKDKT